MIQLDYRDARPIYEQVKLGLRRLLYTGVISENEKLPSVRELASALTINPNTIQRAYRELEAEGYLYSIPGKGTFASAMSELPGRQLQTLLSQFDELVKEILFLSVSPKDLTDRIMTLSERSTNND